MGFGVANERGNVRVGQEGISKDFGRRKAFSLELWSASVFVYSGREIPALWTFKWWGTSTYGRLSMP